uniref:Uncharacterized protein n=1 Tax=Timema bartmani TaxID=61472 RepID=A0A7R9HVP6_9NEOP|nr:unnamed protein product [Timema bartmani]
MAMFCWYRSLAWHELCPRISGLAYSDPPLLEAPDEPDERRSHLPLVKLVEDKLKLSCVQFSYANSFDKPKFSTFDSRLEDIKSYFAMFEHFCTTETIAAGVRAAWLLRCIGPVTYQVLTDLCPPVAPGTNAFAQLKTLLETHYAPTRSVYEERSAFSSRKQRVGESYAAFSLSLLHLAATSNFGTFLDDTLKSQFYHNISLDMVRDKIKNEEGNFSSMVALTSHYEIPGPATAPANASDNPNLINAVRPYQQKNKKFKEKFQSSQGPKPQLSVKNSSQHQGGVRQIQEDMPSASVQTTTSCDLYVVNNSQAPASSSVQLKVNAASANLIGEPVYLAHFKHLPLVSTTRLRGCTGHELDLLGETPIRISYQRQSATLPLVLVQGPFPSLLGISWIRHINLDWNAIFSINYVWQVQGDVVGLLRNKYPSVFKEVPGDIKGVEVNVVLKEGAIPVFYGPRVIPIPLRNAAKKALKEIESSGFIQKTNSHTWGTPLVIVPRANKSARISLVSLGPLTTVQVATETRKDPILSRVLTYVLNGWPDVVPEFTLFIDGRAGHASTYAYPTSYGPTPGPLIQPLSVADHSLPASSSTKPSTDSTLEALRWVPSVMPPGLQCLRECMPPRASSPNSSPGAAPVTTRPGRQLEHQITSTEWENGGIAKDEGASLITFPIFKKELTHLISLRQALSATETTRLENAVPFWLPPPTPTNTTNVSVPPTPSPNFIKLMLLACLENQTASIKSENLKIPDDDDYLNNSGASLITFPTVKIEPKPEVRMCNLLITNNTEGAKYDMKEIKNDKKITFKFNPVVFLTRLPLGLNDENMYNTIKSDSTFVDYSIQNGGAFLQSLNIKSYSDANVLIDCEKSISRRSQECKKDDLLARGGEPFVNVMLPYTEQEPKTKRHKCNECGKDYSISIRCSLLSGEEVTQTPRPSRSSVCRPTDACEYLPAVPPMSGYNRTDTRFIVILPALEVILGDASSGTVNAGGIVPGWKGLGHREGKNRSTGARLNVLRSFSRLYSFNVGIARSIIIELVPYIFRQSGQSHSDIFKSRGAEALVR